jgi:hypothetical protein
VAVSTWALAAASAASALVGLSRHALLVAIAFRALTAWRLTVAGDVVWRQAGDRASTVRLAALGSGAAHAALVVAALGATTFGAALPGLHRTCVAAARCSPLPCAMLPLGIVGIAHAAWLWRHAPRAGAGVGTARGVPSGSSLAALNPRRSPRSAPPT